MLGLTNLGIVHTLFSLVAVGAGIVAFLRYGAISSRNAVGMTYVVNTVLTCLTGFGIFQHGGFGPPHILGVITLVSLAVILVAERANAFGRASAYVTTIGYSLTFFFHMIPAFTETSTRLPPSAPLASGPDDPKLQAAIGVAFVGFLIGAVVQYRRLKAKGS
jgi:uncharacterized membrane protein